MLPILLAALDGRQAAVAIFLILAVRPAVAMVGAVSAPEKISPWR